MDRHVTRAIGRLDAGGDITIQPLPDHDWPDPQMFKALRWVTYDPEFEEFDCVFIGDVDMMILRESPDICQSHLDHCRQFNLPYSNLVRRSPANRLHGTHFVVVQDYYPGIRSIMEREHDRIYRHDFRATNNEELLLNIIEEAGFGFPLDRSGFIRHHGVHLRVFNDDKDLAHYRQQSSHAFREYVQPHHRQFLELIKTQLCQDILSDLRCMDYSPAVLAKYPAGGPRAVAQLNNVVSVCHELMESV
tara:strand:- start:1903 stop:2643 length:741 start_codon:yes stop_codon:yes gene_type:complete